MIKGTIKVVRRGGEIVAEMVGYDEFEVGDVQDPTILKRILEHATAMSRVRATNDARTGGKYPLAELQSIVLNHGLDKNDREIATLSITGKKDELMEFCVENELLED